MVQEVRTSNSGEEVYLVDIRLEQGLETETPVVSIRSEVRPDIVCV